MEKIGHYQLIRPIGAGGMGEVFLAYDPHFKREVALKRIRKDLKNYESLKERFLKEARITGQFTHPGIISIYTIHQDPDQLYYIMPYVEGKTLKQMIRDEKSEIPTLMRVFFAVAQAVSYAHSKGFIHRDLKPENILVGTYGEVVILDWGLALSVNEVPEDLSNVEIEQSAHLTQPGKLVGTLAYMAPERVLDGRSTFQTDIYALGVILFQILTLKLPFQRGKLKEFRKVMHLEKISDPEEIAPYRDVPPRLSKIVKKCLDPIPDSRYQDMKEVLRDLTNHLEGKSDWMQMTSLDIEKKSDWLFQENVLISRNIAITRTIESADWVSIMVSNASFPGNLRLSTKVKINEHGQGIGILLSVPENSERKHPQDGYCLWFGSEESNGAYLFRNSVEVMHVPDLFLKRNFWHDILIEKIDNNIHCVIDGHLRFSYISHLPLAGTHIAILSLDANFILLPVSVFVGSLNLQVSCLAIPDAFLANNDYSKALAEYRRIAYSFPGHAEGRDALFRAGITLLEQAKSCSNKEATSLFNLAIEEFSKLHNTPGAPLEYLGKALVYEALQDGNEEIKCLEYPLRRYKNHPLISAIKEQVVYRMHECAQKERHLAYHLVLITIRHLPSIIEKSDSRHLFKHLIAHWEILPFLDDPVDPSFLMSSKDEDEKKHAYRAFAIPLAFWLALPQVLAEILYELIEIQHLDVQSIGNILFSLIELGSYELAEKLVKELPLEKNQELTEILDFLNPLFVCHHENLEKATFLFFKLPSEDIGTVQLRTACYLMQQGIQTSQFDIVFNIADHLAEFPLAIEDQIQIDALCIWSHLLLKDWKTAEYIFQKYPLELLNQESTLLHTLFGCWLYVEEGEELAMIHFAGVVDTPYPRSWSLLSHHLVNKIADSTEWLKNSFLWERRQLYQQLSLFYNCIGQPQQEMFYQHLEKQEYVYDRE